MICSLDEVKIFNGYFIHFKVTLNVFLGVLREEVK